MAHWSIMAGLLRLEYEDAVYHETNRGNAKNEGLTAILSWENTNNRAVTVALCKLDAVRETLHRSDLENGPRLSCVFKLAPVTP